MNFKKTISLIISIIMIFCLCACTKEEISEEEASYRGGSYPEPTAVAIYAPETSVLFLATVMEKFDAEHPEIIVSATYSDSVDNAEKIMSGYKCDIFVTDNPYLIDFIDIADQTGSNSYDLDLVYSESRADICSLAEEDAEEPTVFSAAILKSTTHKEECDLFMQYLTSIDSATLEEYGYVKAN